MGSRIPPSPDVSGYDRAVVNSLPGKALLGVRFVLGSSSWLTPKFFMLAIGMDPHSNPQAAYMARLFGIRDLALESACCPLAATRGGCGGGWA